MMKYQEEVDQIRLTNKIKKICGKNFWRNIFIENYVIENEDTLNYKLTIQQPTSTIKKEVCDKIENESKKLSENLFLSLQKAISEYNKTINNFRFVDIITNNEKIILKIKNSNNKLFYFCGSDIIKIMQNIFELLLNSEIAVYKVYLSYKDAISRNRNDLISKYTEQMSDLVKITCYSELIESFKK